MIYWLTSSFRVTIDYIWIQILSFILALRLILRLDNKLLNLSFITMLLSLYFNRLFISMTLTRDLSLNLPILSFKISFETACIFHLIIIFRGQHNFFWRTISLNWLWIFGDSWITAALVLNLFTIKLLRRRLKNNNLIRNLSLNLWLSFLAFRFWRWNWYHVYKSKAICIYIIGHHAFINISMNIEILWILDWNLLELRRRSNWEIRLLKLLDMRWNEILMLLNIRVDWLSWLG